MSARGRQQGSSAYQIVIGGLTAIVIGAIVLTFFVYPLIGGFRGTGLLSFETAAGARVATFTDGMWVFVGGWIMIAIVLFIWIETRQ